MEQSEILDWFSERIDFVNSNAQRIVEVRFYNNIEKHVNREYNRIYFIIETDVACTFAVPLNDTQIEDNRVGNFERDKRNFISFYHYQDTEVRTHYYWIVALFKKLVNKAINYKISKYSSLPKMDEPSEQNE